MSQAGIHRSAVLLLALGAEEASEVFKHLGPKEVQKLGEAMAGLKNVPREEVEDVLREFHTKVAEQSGVGRDADAYLRSVLTRALGDDKAAGMLERILSKGGDNAGIESLKWLDGASAAELVKNEHPQIIATILAHLDPDQASDILGHFTDRLKGDVMLRIATLEGVQPLAMRELNDALTRILAGGADSMKKSKLGGVRFAAEIMNFVGTANETAIMAAIGEYDAELAQKIQDEMFVFDNLMDLDDRSIQLLLREVQSENLILALKGANPELREKIFKNMSQRAAEMLREDLESKGPVRLSEVEAAQKDILKTVRTLSESGQIVLGGAGGEAMLA
jgi:flagellar motor switch protein FliG